MHALTPERWQRLAPILDEALDLAPETRAAFLDRACLGDAQLRAELQALVDADAVSGDFLADSAEAWLGRLPEEQDALPAGARLGPYRVVREIARGGMGAVYLGERADGQFEQSVALKVVRSGRDSTEIRRRFLAERRILARLEHPNIARLLDGGVTEDGRPWFAMEYVAGEPIVAYAQARQLPVTERLRLIAEVCEAVRYAHQNLVVHRDLKPSNILVAEGDRVKLLDFGISKLLEDGALAGESDPAPATRTELRVLTPEYAAPEQVRGEPVTTATDVYALGAVLYELLSGRRAHQLDRHTPSEIERVICEAEPAPPSAAADSPQLRRALRGDLDTIALKALQKEPARRYPSAEAMLQDIRRWLGGLPIAARPDSFGYRSRKFIQRHRVGVAATAALLLSLVGGLAATWWQAQAKALEAAKAREVQNFLVSLFEVSDPEQSRGREITARELLERGVRRVDSALAGQPAVQEELLGILGKIHRELGLYAQSDTIFRRAVEVAQRVYGPEHVEVAARMTQLGTSLKELGEFAPAESVLERAVAIQRRVGAGDAELANSVGELANVLTHIGKYARAESLFREALALDIEAYGPDGLDVATDLNNLGVLLDQHQNRLAEADTVYRRALAIRVAQLDPGHPDIILQKGNIASNLHGRGLYAEAESLYREVLAERRRIYSAGHPDIAHSLHTLGNFLVSNGKWVEAESLMLEALALRRRFLGPDHPTTMGTLNNLAILRFRMDDLPGAESAFRDAVRAWEDRLGPQHEYTVMAKSNLGVVLCEEGRYREADSLLRGALAVRQATEDGEEDDVAKIRRNLGVLLYRTGRPDEAERELRNVVATYRHGLPEGHPRIAEALTSLGQVLTRSKAGAAEADSLLREALEVRTAKLGATDLRTVETREALGRALVVRGQRSEGDSLVRAACREYEASPWGKRKAKECRSASR